MLSLQFRRSGTCAWMATKTPRKQLRLFYWTRSQLRPPRTWTVYWKWSAFAVHPSSPKSVVVAVVVVAEVAVAAPGPDERLRGRCLSGRTNLLHVSFRPDPSMSMSRSVVARRTVDLAPDTVAGRAWSCTFSWPLTVAAVAAAVVVEKAALSMDWSWSFEDEG